MIENETVRKLQIEAEFVTDITEIHQLLPEFESYATSGAIVIRSFYGEEMTGLAIFLPLRAAGDPLKKQAVYLARLTAKENNIAKALLREGLMCCWEAGYHVAFVLEEKAVYYDAGFQKISHNFFYRRTNGFPVLAFELSWNGLEMISSDLLLPFQRQLV